jgi:hypothetical protein
VLYYASFMDVGDDSWLAWTKNEIAELSAGVMLSGSEKEESRGRTDM